MATHDFEHRVGRLLEAIEESDAISDHNRELIREYHRDRSLQGLSQATHQKNLSYLKVVAEHVGDRPLDAFDVEDVKDLVEWTQGRDVAPGTVNTYKEIIRLFWTWIHRDDPDLDDDEYPECVDWIQTEGYSSGKLPQDLLTEDDVEAQIDAAYNYRDKALIALLWETGARIGEIIDLTVGDIEDREHGRKVVIDGKTGSRRLPLRFSVPYLNRWLADHPNPEKDAPLWCKVQQGGPDDDLGYRYIRDKILDKNMEKAGIDKPSNPHHYRHSRASHLANHLKEAQLCEWFGWVQGSDVPAKYVHLSGRDLDDAYDAMHGDVPGEETEEPDRLDECPRCDWMNEQGIRYCDRCGFDLEEGTPSAEVPESLVDDLRREWFEQMQLLVALDRELPDGLQLEDLSYEDFRERLGDDPAPDLLADG